MRALPSICSYSIMFAAQSVFRRIMLEFHWRQIINKRFGHPLELKTIRIVKIVVGSIIFPPPPPPPPPPLHTHTNRAISYFLEIAKNGQIWFSMIYLLNWLLFDLLSGTIRYGTNFRKIKRTTCNRYLLHWLYQPYRGNSGYMHKTFHSSPVREDGYWYTLYINAVPCYVYYGLSFLKMHCLCDKWDPIGG